MKSKKGAKETCIYHQAALKAAETQNKALCLAKGKSYKAEWEAVSFLNQFELEG